jgi:pilus assembly protein CpaC
MQTMTNYPGCPRGWIVVRALASAGAVIGLVALLARAASAAPDASVTIRERSAAQPAAGLAAVRRTARPAKSMTELQPSAFILETAARRLHQSDSAAGTTSSTHNQKVPQQGTKVQIAGVHGSAPLTKAFRGQVVAAAHGKITGAVTPQPLPCATRPVARKTPVRLAQADASDGAPAVSPEFGNLKTAPAASDSRIRNFGGAPGSGPIQHGSRSLKVGESQVLGFRWVTRVAIGNPTVADVVPVSDNQVLLNGKTAGETNLFVWDSAGQHEYKVDVVPGTEDMGQVARLVSRDLGRDDIKVQAINDSLFLFGQVKTQGEQQQAEAVAAAYTKNVHNFIRLVQEGAAAPEHPAAMDVAAALNQIYAGSSVHARPLTDGTTVVLEGNVTGEAADQARHVAAAMAKGVTIVDYFQPGSAGARQVLVRSRVIDIDKVKSRELGIDWGPVQNVLGAGGIVQKIVGQQPFNFGEARNGPLKLDQGGPLSRFDPIGFKLRALENQNAARVLSEPNLLIMEGNKGGILIGGEIPIPVAQQAGTGVGTSITVEYKPFGIRLDVQVLGINGDNITMRISPEVSSLDYTNAVTVNGFNLPALRTRRTDTVVQIRNGQTLAIGGLLQNDINKQVKAIPFLSKIPILGELFKDTQFQKGESELVILVTPELPGPDNTVSTPIPNVKMERPSPDVKAPRY